MNFVVWAETDGTGSGNAVMMSNRRQCGACLSCSSLSLSAVRKLPTAWVVALYFNGHEFNHVF